MKAAVIRSEYLCRRLKGRRDNLRARIKTLQRIQDLEPAAPGDMMDHAKSCADSEMRTSLIDCAEQELWQIDQALARAGAGEYGLCSKCGEAIPPARLEAVPFTAYCVDCAASHAPVAAPRAPGEQVLFRYRIPPPEAGESSLISGNSSESDGGDLAGEPSADDELAFEIEASEGHPPHKE
jgi:RNA polymerase-binding protein DksA